jgi:hypothetical protein
VICKVFCVGVCKIHLTSVGTITSGLTMLERKDRVLDCGKWRRVADA